MNPRQIVSQNNITIYRESGEGFPIYSFNGKVFPLDIIKGNMFKIYNKDFNGIIINQTPEFKYYEIKTNDGIRTFMFVPTTKTQIVAGGGGGGGISKSSVMSMINGTTNFIAKFTPDGHHVGNSSLFDNGISIGFGTTIPNADATFDIQSTTQGFLIPRMTTAQRNAIVNPPTSLLIFNTDTGLFNYWTGSIWTEIEAGGTGEVTGIGTTNFITKWTNGPSSIIGDSTVFDNGTNVGIGTVTPNNKLQVGGAITTGIGSSVLGAIVFQNATNNNTVAITSGITTASYSVSLPTSQGGANTFLENDGAGNLSWGTVSLTNFYQNGGNAFGGNATIGLTDNFNWSFLTNNIVRGLIDNTGLWAIGSSTTTAGTELAITGTGASNATYVLRTFNSNPTEIFSIRNDAYVYAGLANGSMTIGALSGFDSTIISNTFIGVNIASGLSAGGDFNTAVGHQSLKALTSGDSNSAFGANSLEANTTGTDNCAFGLGAMAANTTGADNCAFGFLALASNLTTSQNSAFGHQALENNIGTSNTGIGYKALNSNTSGVFNTAVGSSALFHNVDGSSNAGLGYQCLFTNVSGNGNTALGYLAGNVTTGSFGIFIGALAGAYETGSNAFYVNNQDRTNTAGDKSLSLMYGFNAATTANQFLRINANVGINTNTFGTSADGVLAIHNGTAPTTSSANASQIYSANVAGAGTASIGLFLEQAVVNESVVSDRTLLVTINGTLYKICLKA